MNDNMNDTVSDTRDGAMNGTMSGKHIVIVEDDSISAAC